MVAPGVKRSMRALRVAMRKQRELNARGVTESDQVMASAMHLAMLDASFVQEDGLPLTAMEGAEINIAAVAEARAVA